METKQIKLTCNRCGIEFTTKNSQKRYCSDECKRKAKKKRERERMKNIRISNKIKNNKRSGNMDAIERIANYAMEAEHLSYGQYVAKYGL